MHDLCLIVSMDSMDSGFLTTALVMHYPPNKMYDAIKTPIQFILVWSLNTRHVIGKGQK